MDELRLSLLALFVALIAGIYIRELLRRRRPAQVEADRDGAMAPAGAGPLASSADDGPLPSSAHETLQAPADGQFREDAPLGLPGDEITGTIDDLAEQWLGEETEDSFTAMVPDGSREVPLGDIDLLSESDAGALRASDLEAHIDRPETTGTPFAQGQLDLDGMSQPGADAATAGDLPAAPGEELIIVLHVMHKDREDFAAGRLQAALGTAQLQLGEMSIYHHYGLSSAGAGRPVFSVARAVEPGTFDAADEGSFVTPGLTLFMRLPGAEDGAVVLELMFSTAQMLARDLEAVVLDERRNPLSAQALNHLRDRVAEFGRRLKLTNA